MHLLVLGLQIPVKFNIHSSYGRVFPLNCPKIPLRDKQPGQVGRRGSASCRGGITLHSACNRYNSVESLQVQFRGKANKVDAVVGIYCRSSIKYDDINVLLYKALGEISKSTALGLTDGFYFLELNLRLSYVIHKQVQDIPEAC